MSQQLWAHVLHTNVELACLKFKGRISLHCIERLELAFIGEWRLNHIHSINHVEVINASLSDFSAEIDYSFMGVTCRGYGYCN